MEKVYFPYLSGKSHEGSPLAPPEAIDWYPERLAYKLDIPKQVIRKNPDFKKFQKFLVLETDAGNLIRQEAVSMIPPLLMNIKSDSVVLDMCAAPGSKTSQMVEYLHADVEAPTGLVVANDSDFKRAYMLTHQVKRLNSPNFVVTNHDATFLANFYNDENKTVQKFDCVLADVPCSGDGTLRKNVDVWKNWTVKGGISLHPTQVNCLRRGLQMLKVGGRLVYSTCSLNPIENEAVLAAVLTQVKGCAHLVDVSDQLVDLKRRPGLHTWRATDNDGNYISSIDDVKKDKYRFPTSVFPPSPEIAEELHLERAIRVYPHLSDTGGFFVAVIDKTAEISGDLISVRYKPDKPEKSEVPAAEELDEKPTTKRERSAEPESAEKKVKTEPDSQPQQIKAEDSATNGTDIKAEPLEPLPHEVEQVIGKPKFMKSLNDEYFKFLPEDHPELKSITNYYGFTKHIYPDCFLSRNISGEPVRSLYYTSPLVKALLVHNESRMKFVHAGIKMFNRQNVNNIDDGSAMAKDMCKWRIAQDGMGVIKDAVSQDRYVTCTLEELYIFMKHEYPRSELFTTTEGSVMAQLKDKPYGCYIVKCDLTQDTNSHIPEILHLPLWKSRVTLQMMLARKDKEAVYTRITGEELPPAIKIDTKTVRELEAAPMADDEREAVDSVIADAAATEEEGRAARIL